MQAGLCLDRKHTTKSANNPHGADFATFSHILLLIGFIWSVFVRIFCFAILMLMDAEKPRNAGVEARIKAVKACINIHTGEAVHIFSTLNLNSVI